MSMNNDQTFGTSTKMGGLSERHGEGKMTRAIEVQTSRVPSLTFLVLAGASMVASLACKVAGKDKTANFIGQWVPSILLLGIYNKIVKEELYAS